MEKLKKTMCSDIFKEIDYRLPPEEERFVGFDVCDETLVAIEKKKYCIKMEVIKMETDQTLTQESNNPSVVNDNHINRKSKLKSSRPSLEKNDIKHNKKFKKDPIKNESMESISDAQNTSVEPETLTPSNLTLPSKARRSVGGRKVNVDINDAIFKLPFEHGWKRELVYRTNDSIVTNRGTRNGDVYYYSPNNRKLRSLREIQEQLNLSLTDNNPLSIESFTFLKQPIGINDRSKELIREANAKLSKEDSFVGIGARSKKSKTPARQPYDYELSDSENNKSTNKMKIVFKNEKITKSRSKKDKSNVEATSSSTPEYVNEDWQAIQSNVASVEPPLKTADVPNTANDITSNKKPNKGVSDVNGELPSVIPESMAVMQSFNYMVNSMAHVFKYLKVHELLTASRVCNAWHILAMNKRLWRNIRLKNSMVHDWERFIDTFESQGSISLDMRRMLIPTKVDEFENFWLCFSIAIKRARRLKTVELYRCPPHVVEDIIYALPQIEVLNATSIKNPQLKDVKHLNDYMALNLAYVGQMTKLTELRMKGLSGIKMLPLPSFENLVNLKTLSLTSAKVFSEDICRSLDTLPVGLETLEIGDCDCLNKEFATSLSRLVNLKSLRLENCVGKWENYTCEVFAAIRSLGNLRNLELINIEFTDTVEDELEKCHGIKALLIIPVYISQSATTNCHLLDCLKKLSNTLTHLVWGLTHELLRVTDLFISQYQQNQHAIGYDLELSNTKDISNNIPILRIRKPKHRPGANLDECIENLVETDKSDNVDILSVSSLEKLLTKFFSNAKTKVIKIPYSGTTRVYLTDHFNDLGRIDLNKYFVK